MKTCKGCPFHIPAQEARFEALIGSMNGSMYYPARMSKCTVGKGMCIYDIRYVSPRFAKEMPLF